MPGRRLTIDVVYDRGDAVNYQGCNGYVTALVLVDGLIWYEVRFKDEKGDVQSQLFQRFELEEGHAV